MAFEGLTEIDRDRRIDHAAIAAALVGLLGIGAVAVAAGRAPAPALWGQAAYGVFFLGLAWGIRRRSRVAATAAFALYVLERLVLLFSGGQVLGTVLWLLVIGGILLAGVRGTLEHHRRRAAAPSPGD